MMKVIEKIHPRRRAQSIRVRPGLHYKKSQTQDIGDVINSFVVLVQKIHGSVWTPETLRISIDNLKSPAGK